MEKDERDHILANLNSLLGEISCTSELLTYLRWKGVLAPGDIAMIESKLDVMAKNMLLLDIIQTRDGGYSSFIDALSHVCQTGARKLLLKFRHNESEDDEATLNISPTKRRRRGIQFEVYPPGSSFTGRCKELSLLRKFLIDERLEAFAICCISGLGGVGKTQLTRKFIKSFKSEFDHNIVWMNAETEETLMLSFRRLAKDKLGIGTLDANGKEKERITIVEDVYQKFMSDFSKVLIVFDNVENRPYIRKFLELPAGLMGVGEYAHLSILILSGERDWDLEGSDIHAIHLDPLDIDDAIAFVKKGLNRDEDHDILSLVKNLNRFPLALQQAISYINERRCTTQEYLDELKSDNEELLSYHTFKGYEQTTFHTWNLCIRKISADRLWGQLATRILNFMAYISPDNISAKMLLSLCNQADDVQPEKDLNKCIMLLSRYSLINANERFEKLTIHRLMQRVLRLNLRQKNQEEATLCDLLTFVSCVKSDETLEYLSHAMAVWDHVVFLCKNLVLSATQLPCKIAFSLRKDIRYDEGYNFIEGPGGKKILEDVLHNNHEDLLKLEYELCISSQLKCKHQDALDKTEALLERQKKVLGEENELTLETEHLQVRALRSLGRYDEACSQCVQLVEKKRKALGYWDEQTLRIINFAGVCFHDRGDYKIALKYYEKALERYKSAFGEWSPGEFKVLYNMALAHSFTGNLEIAINISKQLYVNFGRYQIDMRQACEFLINLGYDLMEFGELSEAKESLQIGLKLSQEYFGEDHAITLNAHHGIGVMTRLEGNLLKSFEILGMVNSKYSRIFGERHRHTLVSKAYMHLCLIKHKGFEDSARRSLLDVIKTLQEMFGESHLYVLQPQLDYARVLAENHESKNEALELLKEMKAAILRSFPDNHFILKHVNEIMSIL